MSSRLRLAVAGIGNNISALMQGIYFYRDLIARGAAADTLPGIRRTDIGGFGVDDVELVAAFDIDPRKIGSDLADAVFAEPNNYPSLGVALPPQNVAVVQGLVLREAMVEHRDTVVATLRRAGAELLLYSLPTGLQWAADAYAECALEAGVGFVNCTPEIVGRNPDLRTRFADAGVPLIGDDLASHLGTSVVHRALLQLVAERGLTLNSSYQLNIGGNEDFRNLLQNGGSKRQSKKNALAQNPAELDRIEVVPSAGYIAHLKDNKVAILNIEAAGWGGTPISVDLKLKVQDSSNAAGVIIDLIRIAAAAGRKKLGGFHNAASPLLKSPPFGHGPDESMAADSALRGLAARDETASAAAAAVRIGIVAYDGVDELDLVGVYAPLAKVASTSPDLQVQVVGTSPSISGSNGMSLRADQLWASPSSALRFDALVIPGGAGAARAAAAPLADMIRAHHKAHLPIYTVCSGALLLGELGLLEGKRVAFHARKGDTLAERYGCVVSTGVIRDTWLTSAGGFTDGSRLKAVEIALNVLHDFAPAALPAVEERIECWRSTSFEASTGLG